MTLMSPDIKWHTTKIIFLDEGLLKCILLIFKSFLLHWNKTREISLKEHLWPRQFFCWGSESFPISPSKRKKILMGFSGVFFIKLVWKMVTWCVEESHKHSLHKQEWNFYSSEWVFFWYIWCIVVSSIAFLLFLRKH